MRLPIEHDQDLEIFYDLSSIATGYTKFDLLGTGVGSLYLATIKGVFGDQKIQEMFQSFIETQKNSKSIDTDFKELFLHEKFNSIITGIIELWYIGNWNDTAKNIDYVVSGQTYLQALMWRTIGTHAMGGNPFGYGTWNKKPMFI